MNPCFLGQPICGVACSWYHPTQLLIKNSIYPVSLISVLSDSSQVVGRVEVVSSQNVSRLLAAPDLTFIDTTAHPGKKILRVGGSGRIDHALDSPDIVVASEVPAIGLPKV